MLVTIRDLMRVLQVHKWNAFFCEVCYKRCITGLRTRVNLSLMVAGMT